MKNYLIFVFLLSFIIHTVSGMGGFSQISLLCGSQKDSQDESRYVLITDEIKVCTQDCGNYTCEFLAQKEAPSVFFAAMMFGNVSTFTINPIWDNKFNITGVTQTGFFSYLYPIPEIQSTCYGFENCFTYMLDNIYADNCIGYILTPLSHKNFDTCFNSNDKYGN